MLDRTRFFLYQSLMSELLTETEPFANLGHPLKLDPTPTSLPSVSQRLYHQYLSEFTIEFTIGISASLPSVSQQVYHRYLSEFTLCPHTGQNARLSRFLNRAAGSIHALGVSKFGSFLFTSILPKFFMLINILGCPCNGRALSANHTFGHSFTPPSFKHLNWIKSKSWIRFRLYNRVSAADRILSQSKCHNKALPKQPLLEVMESVWREPCNLQLC
ncbi:hypothetical protein RRG08_045231 [Elysia crispata]|uniref:Uncharacterized protein n=1 Tax=Elysia crispata TaxID=231223 RepID=A0AAE1A1R3_9GAST|nr:hypothetical protein RRG08_045231 [Elysia crispata]